MGSFSSQDYVNRFGSALSAAAEGDRIAAQDAEQPDDQSGSADPGPAFGGDPDQEQSNAQTQAGTKNAAPLPGQRQMFGGAPNPPPGVKPGGSGAFSGGATPAVSGGQSPDQQAMNAAHAQSMDQLSDDDLKQYRDYLDGHLANTGHTHKDTGEAMDFDALYQHTFHTSLKDHAALAEMNEKQASKFLQPTWRDKIGMFLDAQNRAGIIHAQNPQISTGDIWAIATRNALQGWAANAQGQHDAVLRQSSDLQKQARQDANDAIKRHMDVASYGDKISKARKANADADKADIDNASESRMREAEIAEKQAGAGEKKAQATKAANDKGTLVTVKNDDGTESTGYIDQKTNVFTPAKDASGKPVGGQVQKTGTEKAENDDKLMTQAREAYQAEVKNIRANVRNRKLSDKEVAQQALDTLKTTSPRLYAAYTKSADSERPSKPGLAAKQKPHAAPKTVSWDQPTD